MTPELLSPQWFSALFAIVLIDLMLAGDNAIVIGLAARHVPAAYQRRVVLWGTAGAIVVRTALTLAVVWLLKIPAFLLVGGLALIYIGWKLTHDPSENARQLRPASTVRGAVQTIIVADAVMGVDNVLAVGGAAQGSFLLVVTGLALSIPIVIWGSTLVLKWIERIPAILWVGAAVLGWTSAKMIANEPLLKAWFESYPLARTASYVAIIGSLVVVPMWAGSGPSKARAGRGAGIHRALAGGMGLDARFDRCGFRSPGSVEMGRRDHRSGPLDRLAPDRSLDSRQARAPSAST